jgi:hypothetical protein
MQPAGAHTLQEQAMEYVQSGIAWVQNNRSEAMVIVILLFVLRIYFQLCSI